MLTSTRGSCLKRNWRANERLPRRREIREAVRLAAYEARDALSAAVRRAGRARCVVHLGRHRNGAGGSLAVRHGCRSLRGSWLRWQADETCGDTGSPVGCARVHRLSVAELRAAICTGANYAVGRTTNDVRPAQGDFRASPAI